MCLYFLCEEVPIAYILCSGGYIAREREKRESTPIRITISACPTSERKKFKNVEAGKKNINTRKIRKIKTKKKKKCKGDVKINVYCNLIRSTIYILSIIVPCAHKRT